MKNSFKDWLLKVLHSIFHLNFSIMGKNKGQGGHHHHEHHHIETDDDKVENRILNYLKTFKSQIMGTLKSIQEELTGLRSDVATERAEVKERLDELVAKVDELTANIEAGGTTEERQAIVDDIKSIRAEVATIYEKPIPGGETGEGTGEGTGEEV